MSKRIFQFFTEEEMLRNERINAAICIGGMIEGFDYSDAKTKMKFWANQRRKNSYSGGYVEISNTTLSKQDSDMINNS